MYTRSLRRQYNKQAVCIRTEIERGDGHLSYMLGLHVLPMISEKIRQDMNLSII